MIRKNQQTDLKAKINDGTCRTHVPASDGGARILYSDKSIEKLINNDLEKYITKKEIKKETTKTTYESTYMLL